MTSSIDLGEAFYFPQNLKIKAVKNEEIQTVGCTKLHYLTKRNQYQVLKTRFLFFFFFLRLSLR